MKNKNKSSVPDAGTGLRGRPQAKLIFLGALTLVLGVVLYLSLAGDDDRARLPGDVAGSGDSSQASGGAGFGEIDPDTVSELLEYRMSTGKAYEYSFDRIMQATINGETMVDLKLGGLVTPHVVRSEQGRLDLIVAVRLDKTEGIEATELPGFKKSGGKNLSYLAHLQIDRTGHPLFLRFSSETIDHAEQGLIRDVISAWLQPLPGPGSRPRTDQTSSWFGRIFGGDAPAIFGVQGTDTQGLYDAALRLGESEESATLRFDLAKETYRDSLTPIQIEASDHNIAWRIEHGTFGGSAGKDRFLMGPSEFQVDSSMQYAYTLNDVRASQFDESDLRRFTINADIYDVESYLSDRAVDVPEQTRAKPWTEIKPRLQTVTPDMPGEERNEIFNTLAVSMKANPAMSHEAAAAARTYNSTDHRFQMVMGALSYSGSPDAQAELMSMYRDGNLDMVGQTSVIDAFTMMDGALTDEGLQFLQEAFASDDSDISGRAGLALGSAQRNKPTETLRQWIIERWRKAKNDGQRQTVLEYVGNSGDPALLTIIDEAMRVGDFDLQQLALFSTRFMEDDSVDNYLLKRFQNREFHERLRYEALSSLTMHTWQERFLPIMENCVRDESMEAMRMRCARFTLEQLRHERRMKNLLASLRSSVRSESLQEFIDRELAD